MSKFQKKIEKLNRSLHDEVAKEHVEMTCIVSNYCDQMQYTA